jgi:large subunit ribosomal protein L35
MKIKTHSGAKKRIKKTGTGKKTYNKAAKRHLLTAKSKRQKSVSSVALSPSNSKAIDRLLPNG